MDETAENYMAIRRGWLTRRGISDDCALIMFDGRAMSPPLPEISAIMVDRRRRDREAGRVYALSVTGSLVVRRAGWERGRWLLMTENSDSSADWPDGAIILGEVRF